MMGEGGIVGVSIREFRVSNGGVLSSFLTV
jgi:hypothetical protein